MKLYRLLFLNFTVFINKIKTDSDDSENVASIKTNVINENKITNKKNKKNINELINEVVDKIAESHNRLKSVESNKSADANKIISEKLYIYADFSNIRIDKRMEFKLQEYRNKGQAFQEELQQEFMAQSDLLSEGQKHCISISFKAAMEKAQAIQETNLKKYTNDKQKYLDILIDKINEKLSQKNIDPIYVYENKVHGKSKDRITIIDISELVNEYYSASINTESYIFPSYPQISEIFSDSEEAC